MKLVRVSPRRGASNGAFILAFVGFVLALATAGYVVMRDPPWGRLSKYSFSTPEGALRSELKMVLNADVQAKAELRVRTDKNMKFLKEKLDTLKVEKAETFEKATILFITYKREGKEEKTYECFEKDDDSKLWKSVHLSPSDVRGKNDKLAKEMADWGSRNFGGMGGPD